MKYLHAMLRKIKIRYRLLATFLLVSVIPVTFFGMRLYAAYYQSITERVSHATEQTVEMLSITMETELKKYSSYLGTLSMLPSVREAVAETPTRPYTADWEKLRQISNEMSANIMLSQYLRNIQICDRDGNVLYARGFDDISEDDFTGLLSAIDQSPNDSLHYMHTYRGKNTIVMGRKLYSIGADQVLGYILIYIDENMANREIMPIMRTVDNASIHYVNEGGSILASQQQDTIGTQLDSDILQTLNSAMIKSGGAYSYSETIQGNRYLVVYSPGNDYAAYTVAILPHSSLFAEAFTLRTTLVVMLLVVISLCFAFTFIIYQSIMRPLNKVMSFCEGVGHEGLSVMPLEGRDEITFLAKTVNAMIKEIEALMAQWQEAQERKRQKELESLQYQISPHFLFNTLDSFKHIATMNDIPALSEGITSLSRLLDNTLATTEEFIPLSDEIDILKHYFSIQRLRYSDCFEVDYQLEPNLQGCKVPRLILQPLAENAVIHGAGAGLTRITITVRSYSQNDGLVLEVEDTGIGFDSSITSSKPKKRGNRIAASIGTKNVHERLQLHYGTAFGLEVDSSVGRGTICRIRIPLEES